VLERLRIINHLRKTYFKVTIEDLYPEKEETGTRVRVDIPVKTASPTPPGRDYFTR